METKNRKTQNGMPGATLAMLAGKSTEQNTRDAEENHSASNPGPQNLPLRGQNPNSNRPPATDHGAVGAVWYSYDLTHRRVQEGGWTHEVTQRELPTSTQIAGVNMRLTAGSYRELHWHIADEWAYMLSGKARLTLLRPDGSMFIDEVSEGDIWLFPAGSPHSIQGIGDDGCEFLLVFNQGSFSEESTFLLSDWIAHTPPDVLAKNFNLNLESVPKLPTDPLYIFPSELPNTTLAEAQSEVGKIAPVPKESFTFHLRSMPPTRSNAHGEVRVVDSRNFPASPNIAAGLVIVKPGGMREMHWHPNVPEWQFYLQGSGRMNVFAAQENARTMDFHASDVGYVPAMAGHYVENTGTTDLIFLEMFAAPEFQDISLNNWLRSLPVQVVMDHLGLTQEEIQAIPSEKNEIV